jgi:hypothetical protein
MKTTKIIGKFLPTFLLLMLFAFKSYGQAKQEYFEIRIYQVVQKAQEDRVDAYLKDVYIPALHRAGIMNVGVFKPVKTDTASFGKLIYVFAPFRTVDQFLQLPLVLNNDKVYLEAAKSFKDAVYNDPPYKRFESILLKAFINMPQFRAPKFATAHADRIYEFRSYESATEAKALKKMEMFNQGGEIKLFERLNFNAAFFGEVIIGSHMPNLMYMTTFENLASREAHWKTFQADPEWLKLKAMPEFLNTVSKNNTLFLFPTDYSDF